MTRQQQAVDMKQDNNDYKETNGVISDCMSLYNNLIKDVCYFIKICSLLVWVLFRFLAAVIKQRQLGLLKMHPRNTF